MKASDTLDKLTIVVKFNTYMYNGAKRANNWTNRNTNVDDNKSKITDFLSIFGLHFQSQHNFKVLKYIIISIKGIQFLVITAVYTYIFLYGDSDIHLYE